MPSSVTEMLAEANAAVPRLSPAEVRDTIGKENGSDRRCARRAGARGKLQAQGHG